MDAIGVATVSIGGFLLYASIKGLHPWQLFTQTLGAAAPASTTPITQQTNVTPGSGIAGFDSLGHPIDSNRVAVPQ